MLTAGKYHTLEVIEQTAEGYLLKDNTDTILLPKREVNKPLDIHQKVKVFLYHDSKNELTATTRTPKGVLGDLVTLKVVDLTPAGAFLDWGLTKDLFVPRSMHEDDLNKGDYCLVKIMLDPETGRVIAKEKLEDELSNDKLTVKEKEVIDCIVYRDTELGFQVIINGKHLGLLHYNEVFKDLYVGDAFTGFVKKIKEGNKIDVMIGKPGHSRVEDEKDPILKLLQEKDGFLPYHDKSPAEEIYKVFGMSKKTFKMTIGNLYKQKCITISEDGIRLIKKK